MPRQFVRLTTAATLAAALLLCSVAVATAATAKFDTSFQNGGTLLLPTLSGAYGQVVQTCEVSGDRLNVAGRFGPNDPGLPTTWRRDQQLATTSIKIRPRQPMMLGIAEVRWTKQRIPTGQVVLDQDFDGDGGFAYVTRSEKTKLRTKLKLFRILPSGRRDPHFGRKGYISITIASLTSQRPEGFRVVALPAGKVLVLAQNSNQLVMLRFTKSGRADSAWGSKGVVSMTAPKDGFAIPEYSLASVTSLPDGGLLAPANSFPGQPSSGTVGLIKFTASGKPDPSWATKGFWRAPAPGTPRGGKDPYTSVGQTFMTSIRKGGDYSVLYADKTSFEDSSESDIKLAYVDQDSGVTTLFNDKVGIYTDGGDGGFPDSEPWLLGESSAGTVVAMAQSFYGRVSNTFGFASRFSIDADTPITEASTDAKDFPTDAFAVDPKSTNLYFCGSLGSTSAKSRIVTNRQQRKAIAIRRIKL